MPRIGFHAALLGVILACAVAGPVLADNGPHATKGDSNVFGSELCALCHRAHTATNTTLGSTPTENLCFSCHGSSAAGATSDTIDGQLAGTGHGLKGGGFGNSLMDTALSGKAAFAPATSAHTVTADNPGTMWGSGSLGSGPGAAAVQLTCLSCHDPHGNGSYRILKPLPVSAAATTGVSVPDQVIKVYRVASPTNRYFGEVYANGDFPAQLALTQWCAACHTRIDAPTNAGHIASGDPIFNFRHSTRNALENASTCRICHLKTKSGLGEAADPFGVTAAIAHTPVCQNCHVAHGSSAIMQTISSGVPDPGASSVPDQAAASPSGLVPAGASASAAPGAAPSAVPFPPLAQGRSWLLRLDNRGVCAGCHDPSGTIVNTEAPFQHPPTEGGSHSSQY